MLRAVLALVVAVVLAQVVACDPFAAGEARPETARPAPAVEAKAPAPASADDASGPPPFALPSLTCPTAVTPRAPVPNVPVPAGWVVLPGAPDEGALHCGNLSRKEWTVRRGGGDVEIQLAAKRPADDPLPFPLTGKAKDGLAGMRHVKPVEGGFLVGFDGGEYGGALWWFGTSGDRRQRLAEENVVGLAELGGVPVAVTGLSHLGMVRGRVLRLSPDNSGGWRVAAWVDLAAAAQTFVSETKDTLLVQTTSGLMRVTACGDVSVIGNSRYDVLYPNSMAVDDAGVITLGMRHFVVRWVPSSSGYREEWLTRIDCARPKVRKFECVCSP